jgi:hypothetical protein
MRISGGRAKILSAMPGLVPVGSVVPVCVEALLLAEIG